MMHPTTSKHYTYCEAHGTPLVKPPTWATPYCMQCHADQVLLRVKYVMASETHRKWSKAEVLVPEPQPDDAFIIGDHDAPATTGEIIAGAREHGILGVLL